MGTRVSLLLLLTGAVLWLALGVDAAGALLVVAGAIGMVWAVLMAGVEQPVRRRRLVDHHR